MDDLPPEDLGSPRNLERLESGNSPMMTLTLSAGLPELAPEIAKADADPAPGRHSENLAEDGLPTPSATKLSISIENIAVGDMDDHQLLAATLTGAEDAFLEITRRYRNQITNYVYRMLDDYDRAVEIGRAHV